MERPGCCQDEVRLFPLSQNDIVNHSFAVLSNFPLLRKNDKWQKANKQTNTKLQTGEAVFTSWKKQEMKEIHIWIKKNNNKWHE